MTWVFSKIAPAKKNLSNIALRKCVSSTTWRKVALKYFGGCSVGVQNIVMVFKQVQVKAKSSLSDSVKNQTQEANLWIGGDLNINIGVKTSQ